MRDMISIATPLGVVQITAESNGEVLLASVELPHSIGNGMTIDRSIACVLTIKPKYNSTDVFFSGTIVDSKVEGSPATGECLDCLEWKTEEWHLTLGTEDQEMLDSRLPDLSVPKDPYPIEYTPSRMVMQLRGIRMLTTTTFHFITSWKMLPDERGCSAWFFADIPHGVANNATCWDAR